MGRWQVPVQMPFGYGAPVAFVQPAPMQFVQGTGPSQGGNTKGGGSRLGQ